MPKIKISFSSLLIIPAVLLDPSGTILATLLSAAVHEIGHLAVIGFCGIGTKEITVTPYGLEITTTRKYKSFGEEIAVNCAGCIVNFSCFFAFSRVAGYAVAFAHASLTLGVLNALPILSLDGGEVLHAILSSVFSFRKAERISRAVSFLTLIFMWLVAVYIFMFSGYNYTLFIMSVWLFCKIYCS